jgi:uncharacterized membrane protein
MWNHIIDTIFYKPISPNNTVIENFRRFLNRIYLLASLGFGITIIFLLIFGISFIPIPDWKITLASLLVLLLFILYAVKNPRIKDIPEAKSKAQSSLKEYPNP